MKIIKPTDSELEILQVLWGRGPSSVREVHDILSETRETGYTTTLKLMQIMLEKDLVSRNDSAKTHIYLARVKEDDIQFQLFTRFVDSTFKGSASRLVMHALGNHNTSKEELDQIKALIQEIEKTKKS